MKDPSKVKSLTLVHNEPEDRLVLLVSFESEEKRALLITRALAGRLINALATVLEKSSIAASQAPAEVRGDLVLMEHQKAVTPPVDQTSPQSPRSSEPSKEPIPSRSQHQLSSPPVLITSVDIATHPTHFDIAVKTGNEIMVRWNTNRVELHRLLALLIRKAEEANWRLPAKAEWLERDRSMAAMN